MGLQFDDLPLWEFTMIEMSPGIYRVTAVRDGGIRGESSGSGPEAMMEDLKDWARKTDLDLEARGGR